MNGSVAAFAVFAAILTITPGLDTFLVLRTTAVSGRAAGLLTAIGIGTGCLVWALASAVGVTAVLAASQAGVRGAPGGRRGLPVLARRPCPVAVAPIRVRATPAAVEGPRLDGGGRCAPAC
jgi:hypothetical protein